MSRYLRITAAYDYGGCGYRDRAVMLGFSSPGESEIHAGIERNAAALGRGRSARLHAPAARGVALLLAGGAGDTGRAEPLLAQSECGG